MGLLKTFLTDPPTRHVIQIERVEERRMAPARVHFRAFTGEETMWQLPAQAWADTVVPKGRLVSPGMLLFADHHHHSRRNNWEILWDEAPPLEAPPMQFPSIPGGGDPAAMIAHMGYLRSVGALDEAGYRAGVGYLERGWAGVL